MNVRELIEMLNKIEDKEKYVTIYLYSPYGSEFDLCADKIKIDEGQHVVDLTN